MRRWHTEEELALIPELRKDGKSWSYIAKLLGYRSPSGPQEAWRRFDARGTWREPQQHATRDHKIRELRKQKFSYREIAEKFGLSRQRVQQIVSPEDP